MSKKIKVLIVILIILVLGLAGYIGYPYAKKFFQITPKNQSSTQPTTTTSTTATTSITSVSDPGVVWLTQPQKLEDLGLINKQDNGVSEVAYYKIANLDSGSALILANLTYEGPAWGKTLARFMKGKDGTFNYLLKHSFEKDYKQAEQLLKKEVTINSTTIYQSLSAPDFLPVKNATLKYSSQEDLFADLSSPKEVAESEYGKIYQTFNKPSSQATDEIGGRVLSLKLADSTTKYYSLKFDFLTDDEVALITWSDGTKNTAKFTPEGYVGCASTSTNNVITNTKNLSQRLIEAGVTASGDKIYAVSASDEVMKAAYENYQTGREKNILSLEDFAAQKPLFIWKDGFGDYVIFSGRDFAGLAECGKPVIYLYPEKDTIVSLKVGADITKSEPLYQNGWQDVLAKPNGELSYQGQKYPYLFWEGRGQGIYPNISEGFVVKKADLKSTLLDHLAKLGLNQKESADFLEFWLPKMPTTAYTRLTWFGTRQMNQLAPLTIVPKPDTSIRVFLDFEGLDQSINIKPQKLSAPARAGFTLVEWGGLLK